MDYQPFTVLFGHRPFLGGTVPPSGGGTTGGVPVGRRRPRVFVYGSSPESRGQDQVLLGSYDMDNDRYK